MAKRNFTSKGLSGESVLRIGGSLLAGGTFYLGWLGIFLLLVPKGGILEAILWITAPIFTSLGFAVGVSFVDKFLKKDSARMTQIIPWPLLGCILGAVAVYWFGPMLIVFSMLVAGTASVTLREFYLYWRRLA